jgi:hypothetical protein
MIEAKSGSNLLYLPLDKLMQRPGNTSNAFPTGGSDTFNSPQGTASRAVGAVRDVIGNNNNNNNNRSLRDRLREVR